ncbi:hypothetical protein D3C76_1184840 [compost metagenome]
MRVLMLAESTDLTARLNVLTYIVYIGRICWTKVWLTAATAQRKNWKQNVKNRLHVEKPLVIPANTVI